LKLISFSADPTYSKETGNAWVVGGHQISYFSPALLMEHVIISSQLVEWNKSDILLEMTMWNKDKTQLKSIIWTRFVHINLKEMKRTDHDEKLTQKLSVDINFTLNRMKFEERLIDLKKQLR
jgi:acyl-CoA thioester hydrolase